MATEGSEPPPRASHLKNFVHGRRARQVGFGGDCKRPTDRPLFLRRRRRRCCTPWQPRDRSPPRERHLLKTLCTGAARGRSDSEGTAKCLQVVLFPPPAAAATLHSMATEGSEPSPRASPLKNFVHGRRARQVRFGGDRKRLSGRCDRWQSISSGHHAVNVCPCYGMDGVQVAPVSTCKYVFESFGLFIHPIVSCFSHGSPHSRFLCGCQR